MKKLVILVMICTLIAPVALIAQKQKEEISVEQMIADRKFVFTANSVLPFRGDYRQLTSVYDLRISKDSVIADLPFFGRAFMASPYNPNGGGIQFTSTGNLYKVTQRKKGGWDIVINPADQPDVKEMFLTVFANGSATLRVVNNNRDPISFTGTVSAGRQ